MTCSDCDQILPGTLVENTVTFTPPGSDTPTDPPGDITVTWRAPDGTTTTYTYPSPGNITRDADGVYTASFLLDAAGAWFVRWEGVGMVTTVDSIIVTPDGF